MSRAHTDERDIRIKSSDFDVTPSLGGDFHPLRTYAGTSGGWRGAKEEGGGREKDEETFSRRLAGKFKCCDNTCIIAGHGKHFLIPSRDTRKVTSCRGALPARDLGDKFLSALLLKSLLLSARLPTRKGEKKSANIEVAFVLRVSLREREREGGRRTVKHYRLFKSRQILVLPCRLISRIARRSIH